jgi:hypothetical protein
MDEDLKRYLDGKFTVVDGRFAELDVKFVVLDRQVAALDGRFAALDGKFAALDGKFVALDGKFAALDGKFAALDGKFASIDDRFVELEGRIMARVDGRMDAAEERMKDFVRQSNHDLETKIITEFHKWGRTSDVRTRQAITDTGLLSERLLAVEDRISALERERPQ